MLPGGESQESVRHLDVSATWKRPPRPAGGGRGGKGGRGGGRVRQPFFRAHMQTRSRAHAHIYTDTHGVGMHLYKLPTITAQRQNAHAPKKADGRAHSGAGTPAASSWTLPRPQAADVPATCLTHKPLRSPRPTCKQVRPTWRPPQDGNRVQPQAHDGARAERRVPHHDPTAVAACARQPLAVRAPSQSCDPEGVGCVGDAMI